MVKVRALVVALAEFPGVDGCALVETSTGMAWHHAGSWPNMEQIGEAAIEFWRIQERLEPQLNALGELRSAAYSFAHRVVTLFPCCDDPRLVLVCVAGKSGMSWQGWASKLLELREALGASSQVAVKRTEKVAPVAQSPV